MRPRTLSLGIHDFGGKEKMRLTRHWSQDDCLSQIVLAHALRQATVWLSFDVRRRDGGDGNEQQHKEQHGGGCILSGSRPFGFNIRRARAGISEKKLRQIQAAGICAALKWSLWRSQGRVDFICGERVAG